MFLPQGVKSSLVISISSSHFKLGKLLRKEL
nr:MAG TPA: hypothetical protein [Caudoviricetes sp.]